MRLIVFQNKAGFTLIEVMIALVVSLLVFLALMQTALVSVDSATRNTLRDEAVNIAAGIMDQERGLPFNNVISDNTNSLCGSCPAGFPAAGKCTQRSLKNISQFNFCTNISCTELGGSGNCTLNDADIKQVTVTVGWQWKGNDYSHRISSIRKN